MSPRSPPPEISPPPVALLHTHKLPYQTAPGAPSSGYEGGSWVSPSVPSLRNDIDTKPHRSNRAPHPRVVRVGLGFLLPFLHYATTSTPHHTDQIGCPILGL